MSKQRCSPRVLLIIEEMKSYYLGDQRFAQRQGGVLTYLPGDPLGSQLREDGQRG